MSGLARYSIPRLYYLVTPGFILLDYFAGLNVRVAVLDDMPLYKNLYYGLCLLCGVAVYLLPRYSAIVALVESPVNFLITILGLFLPYIRSLEHVADLSGDWKAAETFSIEGCTNLILAGAIAAIAFRQSTEALSRGFTDASLGQPPKSGVRTDRRGPF